MARMIHSMIRVREETRSLEFYDKAFGLSVADRFAFEGFTLIYLSNAETGFELELTVNSGQEAPYDLGNGYGHLAVSVDHIEIEHARQKSAGLAVGELKTLSHPSGFAARFFFVTDPDGYRIEVLQRGGRFL